MVAPLVEALLLRLLRGRDDDTTGPRATRLVSARRPVDSVGQVRPGTSVLLWQPDAGVEVLPAGSLVLPALLGRSVPSYAVVSHDPVDVWLRTGPYDTLDDRTVHQVELRLTIRLSSSASGLRELAEEPGGDLAATVLDRLTREVSVRTTEAVRRRTLADLTSTSLAVVLDEALPTTFLGGLVDRSGLEVVDVDWPTEGRGWPTPPAPVPGGTSALGPVPR